MHCKNQPTATKTVALSISDDVAFPYFALTSITFSSKRVKFLLRAPIPTDTKPQKSTTSSSSERYKQLTTICAQEVKARCD